MAVERRPRRKLETVAVTPPKLEPLIRVAFEADDLGRLIERLGDWDDPILHRLRLRYSKHRMRQG